MGLRKTFLEILDQAVTATEFMTLSLGLDTASVEMQLSILTNLKIVS